MNNPYLVKAGREMDELIAEKVMGWHKGICVTVIDDHTFTGHKEDWLDENNHYIHAIGSYDSYEDSEDLHTICWHPSESVLWAWEVVEKMKLKGWRFYYREMDDSIFGNYHHAEFQTGDASGTDVMGEADTAPLAICRAALMAVNHE